MKKRMFSKFTSILQHAVDAVSRFIHLLVNTIYCSASARKRDVIGSFYDRSLDACSYRLNDCLMNQFRTVNPCWYV